MQQGVRTVVAGLVVAMLVAAAAGPGTVGAAADDVTFVESSIEDDTTWTAADGPYRIVQDVTVEADATLHVEPGTEIQLAEDIAVTVRGSLYANGTAARRISITGTPGAPANTQWTALRYAGGRSSRLVLHNATVRGGTDGIVVESGSGAITVADATFRSLLGSAIDVGDVASTPRVTVRRSTVRATGDHAIRADPAFGAAGTLSLSASPNDRDEVATHTLSFHPGVEVTADTLSLEYGGHADVSGVTAESVRRIGMDVDDDAAIDESLAGRVASVSTPGGGRIDVAFDGPVTVPGDARLVVAYGGVRNPLTRGVYPVHIGLSREGVSLLSDGVVARLNVGGVSERFVADRPDGPTRVAGLSVSDSRFVDVGGAAIFVDADRVTGLHISGTTIEGAAGSGIAVRARRMDGTFWYDTVSADDAAIAVAVRERASLDVYGAHLTDSATGLRLRQSGTVGPGTVVLSLRASTLADNRGAGLDADIDDADLVRSTVANTTVTGNGGAGLSLATWNVRGGSIRDTVITDNGRDGLSLRSRSVLDTTVTDNVVAGNGGDGVDIDATLSVRRLRMARNRITDNGGHAVALDAGLVVHETVVRANRLANNAGAGLTVRTPLTHAGTVTVADNLIAANSYGVLLTGVLGARVADNRIVFDTNAFADPIPMPDVRPGTAVRVAEGSAGAIVERGTTDVPLSRLVSSPTLDHQLESYVHGSTAVVLRTDGGSHARLNEDAAVAISSVDGGLPTGIALPKTGATNGSVVMTDNDVYGQERGLTVAIDPLVEANTTARIIVDRLRTVQAEDNFWGAPSGPYHGSILPSGEGDAVVTDAGWVDLIPYRTERIGPDYDRPTARIAAPESAVVGEPVTISGADSTATPGSIATYRFTVSGDPKPAQTTANLTFEMPHHAVAVSLAVEDSLGIDGAAPATATIEPVRPATTTTTPGSPPPTAPPTTEPPEIELVGGLLTLWGLFGALFYLGALVLGAAGMLATLRNEDPPVDGRVVQGLAGGGVVVWLIGGALSTGVLVSVGIAAGVLWGALTGGAYVLATR